MVLWWKSAAAAAAAAAAAGLKVMDKQVEPASATAALCRRVKVMVESAGRRVIII